jgi:hypothetical protein
MEPESYTKQQAIADFAEYVSPQKVRAYQLANALSVLM